MFYVGYLAGVLTLLSFSFGDTISKGVSTKFGNYSSALFIMGFGLIPLLVSLFFLPQSFTNYNFLLISVAAGFFIALGYVLIYKSLETEQVSNTWALINLGSAAAILFGAFVLKEHVNIFEFIGIILVFVGVLLVTITRDFKFNRMLAPALIGNVSLVLSLLLMIYGISNYSVSVSTGFFLVAGASGFLMLTVYLIATKKLSKEVWKKLATPNLSAISAGLLNGVAQVGLTAFVLLHFVVVGSAITAVGPAIVAFLGFVFYKEKLTSLQLAGLMISVIAAVALSLF